MPKSLKIGLVGAGLIARAHLPVFVQFPSRSRSQRFAEIQWPNWSPSKKHRSWVRKELRNHRSVGTLVIDFKEVSSSEGLRGMFWLNDDVVAVRIKEEIKIIRVSDGEVISAHLLE